MVVATLFSLVASVLASVFRVFQQRGFPETKGAVLLEGGHITERSVIVEEGMAPFYRFLHFGTTLVHQSAKMFQDGSCKIGRLGNIGVYAGIFMRHMAVII